MPIITKNPKKGFKYLTLNEARDVEIKDTGSIDAVYIKNNEDIPLYIIKGQIFEGKTQERVTVHSYLIQPHKGTRVPVKCIHASKGINVETDMYYGGKIASKDINIDGTQYEVWNSVNTYTNTLRSNSYNVNENTLDSIPVTRETPCTCTINTNYINIDGIDYNAPHYCCGIMSGSLSVPIGTYSVGNIGIGTNYPSVQSDDLTTTVNNIQSQIREVVKNTPMSKNQVGIIMFNGNKVIGIEYYNHPDKWEAIKDDIISKEGVDVLNDEDDDIFILRKEKVKDFFKKFVSKNINNLQIRNIYTGVDYNLFHVEIGNLKGEVVGVKEEILHLTLWDSK